MVAQDLLLLHLQSTALQQRIDQAQHQPPAAQDQQPQRHQKRGGAQQGRD
jgi:hypothetical protein